MTPAIDITAEQRRTILALLNRHLPDTTVWACGSRVKWTSRPESDLDLVVFARPEQSAQVAELREAFEKSNLPFRVDLFVWEDIPGSFRKRIKSEYRVLVEVNHDNLRRGWREMTLGDVGEVAPYLDMANMPTKGHVPHTVVDRQFGSGMRFTNGDTLVARITPCLENGKTAYVDFLQHDEIGWGSTEYIVMRPRPPLPNEFAYYPARSVRFREFAIQSMTGASGRQRVQIDALSQFLLPVSPKPVVECFGEFVQPFMKRVNEAESEYRRQSGQV